MKSSKLAFFKLLFLNMKYNQYCCSMGFFIVSGQFAFKILCAFLIGQSGHTVCPTKLLVRPLSKNGYGIRNSPALRKKADESFIFLLLLLKSINLISRAESRPHIIPIYPSFRTDGSKPWCFKSEKNVPR